MDGRAAGLADGRHRQEPDHRTRRQQGVSAVCPEGCRMTAPAPAFPGFRPAAFSFFRGLAKHNDPAWFKPRKAVYEAEVLAPVREFVLALTAALQAAAIPLVGDPDRGIFRIYRDVRFSPDKRLYKNHAAAVL